MINLSKYMLEKYGVDDSNFAYPFGYCDKLTDTGEGPIVAVTYDNDPEHVQKSKKQISDILTRTMGLKVVGVDE